MSEILQKSLERFRNGEDLPESETAIFFDALLAETNETLLAGILLAWNEKGTSEDELFAIAKIMRERCVRVNSKHSTFVDAVGTGGSKVKTFNVSTAAAFVIAGAGVPVAKHGNRAATSNSGSADVLSALGVEPAVEPAVAERCLNEIGICFMFAPKFHSLSPVLGKVRRGLGIPTIFNNLGPLCNPANAPHQIIGVWHRDMVEKTARVLARLGTKKSWVVHGEDGLDEITLSGKTFVAEVAGDSVRTIEISPEDFGIKAVGHDGLSVETPQASADLIMQIFENRLKDSAAERLVLMNAAAAIFIAGFEVDLEEAYKFAGVNLRNGEALAKLEQLVVFTNR
jgi:anthranilate phosphoribosyltransferase